MSDDEELFEELQRMVSPPLREPSFESVAALHSLVARQFRRTTRRRRWRQKATVGAALFGLVAGAPAAAFAISGSPLPDPLRTAMHAVGLPVDSVPVADTKTAEADLEHALKSHDETEIGKAAAHLQTSLAELDGTERTRLAPRADALLQAATSDTTDGQQALRESPDAPSFDSNPVEHGASARGGDNNSPRSGSSTSTGTTDSDGLNSQASGSSGGSDDGHQATTAPTSPTSTTSTTLPPPPGTDDGHQRTTTTTISSGQTGGSSDGEGGPSTSDGGSNSDTATTTNPSH